MRDATLAVNQFALALGLEPGIGAPRAAKIDEQSVELARAIVHFRLPPSVSAFSFYAALGARFYPCLVKTVVCIDFKIEMLDNSRTPFCSYVYSLTRAGEAHRARFVRDHPSDMVALYVYLINIVYSLPASSYSPLALTNGRNAALKAVTEGVLTSWQTLVWHYPERWIPVPPATSAQVAAVRRLSRLTAESSRNPEGMASLPQALKSMDKIDMDQVRASAEDHSWLGWWSCELGRRDRNGVGKECAKFKARDEMDQCGRCLVVRYCSREHQRLDWERHKQVCFKPLW